MADTKIDMALDDIIKKTRNGLGSRQGRGRGGNANQRRSGRISKNTDNNRGRGGGGGASSFRRGGGGRNSFNRRNNRSNSFRQQRSRRNTIPGFNRRNIGGDKPTATYNPLSRDVDSTRTKQQQQQQNQIILRNQQGSIFNKIRTKRSVTALQRRIIAAQRALNRATKTLAAMPRVKLQRQKFLQQSPKFRNIITRSQVSGGVIRKRLNNGRKVSIRQKFIDKFKKNLLQMIGRGGARRMFF